MSQSAEIVGKVEYREGDGANKCIRPGAVTVEQTELDVTLSWTDGDTHGAAAMPISDFRRYVASQAIRFADLRG